MTNSTPTLPLLAVTQESMEIATALLTHLAPLYPTIANATRTREGAQAWVISWARQISMSGLSHRQIERGITRLARGYHEPDVPLSWSVFRKLCYNPWHDEPF